MFDSSSCPSAPRTHKKSVLMIPYIFTTPIWSLRTIASPERALILRPVHHGVHTVTLALGGVSNRTHMVLESIHQAFEEGLSSVECRKSSCSNSSHPENRIKNALYAHCSLRKTCQLPKPLSIGDFSLG